MMLTLMNSSCCPGTISRTTTTRLCLMSKYRSALAGRRATYTPTTNPLLLVYVYAFRLLSSIIYYRYVAHEDVPKNWDWRNINGKSHVTKSLNQHTPQYCGSCWAHGALSALADRIKIHQGGVGDEINLSIQYMLNCGAGTAGSCHGGSHTGAYQFIKQTGKIPYDTCLPYIACSAESTEGFCSHVDTTCSALNTCRTCGGFTSMGAEECAAIVDFPHATVSEYGVVGEGVLDMAERAMMIKKEVYTRGPV